MDDLANSLASAYQSGDYGTVNDLISQNQLTQSDIGNMFPGFDTSSVNPAVSYFNPSSAPDNSTNNTTAVTQQPVQTGLTSTPDNSGVASLNTQPLAQTPVVQTPVAQTPVVQTSAATDNTGVASLNAQPLAQPINPVTSNVPLFQNTSYAQNIPVLANAPSTDQIKSYVTSVLNNPNLTQFQKEDQILKAANLNKVSTDQLSNIFGQQNVQNGIKDYNSTISSGLTNTLNNTNLDNFGKVATIAQAASQNGLNAQDIATATGKNVKDIQSLLDSYQTGIGTLAKNITAAGQTPTQITQNALGAEQKYGITDADFAKSLGLKESDVSAYLQPARDVSTQLKSISSNPSVTSSQVQDLISKIGSDPTLTNMYGAQAKTLQSVLPTLQFKDAYTAANSGKGTAADILGNYKQMVDIANNNPALAKQFAPQMQAVQQALQMSGNGQHLSTFETFTGLDKGMTSQATNLPTKTVPTKYEDENGNLVNGTQTIVQQPKGVMATEDGYEQQINTPPGWDPGTKVFAKYDTNGQLTGFYSPNPVFPTDANGNMNGKSKYDAVWNADGSAKPQLDTSHGGAFSSLMESLAPGAGIIAMGLSGGLAGPLTEAITGALTGAGMTAGADVLGGALSQGIIRGGATALGGGSFAKGFDTGAIGSGLTAGLNNVLPTGAGQYLSSPIANAVASSAINGTNLGQGLTNAIQSGGLNYGLNSLLPSVLPDNITPNKTMTGIASTLLPKLINNQSVTQNDLLNILPKLAQGAKT
jgi:hypothetical protein